MIFSIFHLFSCYIMLDYFGAYQVFCQHPPAQPNSGRLTVALAPLLQDVVGTEEFKEIEATWDAFNCEFGSSE